MVSHLDLTNSLRSDRPKGTFTTFGLGSCGLENNNSQMVVGVSTAFFNGFP